MVKTNIMCDCGQYTKPNQVPNNTDNTNQILISQMQRQQQVHQNIQNQMMNPGQPAPANPNVVFNPLIFPPRI